MELGEILWVSHRPIVVMIVLTPKLDLSGVNESNIMHFEWEQFESK